MDKQRKTVETCQKRERITYVKPKLTEYGHIKEITEGSGKSPGEFGSRFSGGGTSRR
jgi:hypothetical protein